ncbi:hypothetical protein VTH06DRAFT_1488 [Thermothelomyces fergusii]
MHPTQILRVQILLPPRHPERHPLVFPSLSYPCTHNRHIPPASQRGNHLMTQEKKGQEEREDTACPAAHPFAFFLVPPGLMLAIPHYVTREIKKPINRRNKEKAEKKVVGSRSPVYPSIPSDQTHKV